MEPGLYTYLFEVVCPHESDFPFLAGHSNTVSVFETRKGQKKGAARTRSVVLARDAENVAAGLVRSELERHVLIAVLDAAAGSDRLQVLVGDVRRLALSLRWA